MALPAFLDIPAETRLSIYHELFRPLTVILSAPQTPQEHYVKVRDCETQDDNHLAVLFTNESVRDEARPVLLNSALFDLTCSKAIKGISSFESLQMTRILISHPTVPLFLHARESFFRGVGDLLKGKDEIQIEVSQDHFFGDGITPASLERHLRDMLSPSVTYQLFRYVERDLLLDCISALYPTSTRNYHPEAAQGIHTLAPGDGTPATPNTSTSKTESTCAGIYLLLRPTPAVRARALSNIGKALTSPDRIFRYNQRKDTLELLDPSEKPMSVQVPR